MLPLTEVTVKRMPVVARAGKLTFVAPPASSSAGTFTTVPSEKVSVPPVTRSPRFGRSKSTTDPTVCGVVQDR